MGNVNETWCILELLGHVRTAGRISEEEKFGAKLGRLDVPNPDGTFYTMHFGGGSVYRITYVGEAEARAVAYYQKAEPVKAWEMPRAIAPPIEVIDASWDVDPEPIDPVEPAPPIDSPEALDFHI